MSSGSRRLSDDAGSELIYEQYSALLRAVPDPVFVADVETGEIIEANQAAEELRGESREDIIGTDHADLHPADKAEQYRRLFEQQIEECGTRRKLPDESRIYAVTGSGERVPVEISAEVVELSDRSALCGVFRDVSPRLEKEQQAKEQEQRYRSFFENNPMVIWEQDLSALKRHVDSLASNVASLQEYFENNPDDVRRALRKIDVVDVNQNAVDYYDAESKDGLIDNVSRLFTKEAVDTFADILVAISKGRTQIRVETVSRTLSGERKTELIELYVPEKYADDYSRGYLVTTDITERKERECQLRTFKQAVDHAGHSILITDTDGTIEYTNPAFEEITGYSREEVLGETPRILKSGEHDEEFYRDLWDTVLDGDVWSAELINEREDGEEIVVDQTIAPVFNDEGDLHRLVAINHDVTDRKEYERHLRQLENAVEHAGHAVFVTDTDGTIEYVNQAFEEMSGYTAEEALGETPGILSSGEHDERFYEDLWETILNGDLWTGEMVNERQHGERFIVDQTIAPIDDSDGTIQGFVGIQNDITGRRLREQQLTVFSRVLRHNLRNKGTAIKGHADLLEDAVSETTSINHVHRIQENIESLLDISEKAHHVQQVVTDSLDSTTERQLRAVLTHITGAIDSSYPDAEVSFEDELTRSVRIDGSVIPAIQELAENGVKHSDGSPPRVTITATEGITTATVTIADNGPGLPDQERRVIEAGTEEQLEHGSGLGLWLAYWLIRYVGGDIDIQADAGGTAISVTLPIR